MKNVLNLVVTTLLTVPSFAVTKPKFLPFDMNMMVAITETDITGAADNDASDLYALMNVSEQDSSMGKGKSMKTADKGFNLVCTKEKKTCSVILNKSANTIISGAKKYASYEITGVVADELRAQFKLTDEGDFAFTATDGLFHIHAIPGHFIFEVQAQ